MHNNFKEIVVVAALVPFIITFGVCMACLVGAGFAFMKAEDGIDGVKRWVKGRINE
jgi:hypothetical protein